MNRIIANFIFLLFEACEGNPEGAPAKWGPPRKPGFPSAPARLRRAGALCAPNGHFAPPLRAPTLPKGRVGGPPPQSGGRRAGGATDLFFLLITAA